MKNIDDIFAEISGPIPIEITSLISLNEKWLKSKFQAILK